MFDIDQYLNPYIPAPRLNLLPYFIAHFLGYRRKDFRPLTNPWLTLASVLISTFTGMLVVLITFKFSKHFINQGVPVIIPSLGATAILMYNEMTSPFGQPRSVFCGTVLSSFVGVVIMRLFMTHLSNEEYLWVGAALSVACASVLMSLFGCIHPPAGAAALLPLVDVQVCKLSWYYIAIQIISLCEMMTIACLFNNILLRYPVFWWTSEPLAKTPQRGNHYEDQTDVAGIEQRSAECPAIIITSTTLSLPRNMRLNQECETLITVLQTLLRELPEIDPTAPRSAQN